MEQMENKREAFENLQRAEAHKKEIDREVLAKYSID